MVRGVCKVTCAVRGVRYAPGWVLGGAFLGIVIQSRSFLI